MDVGLCLGVVCRAYLSMLEASRQFFVPKKRSSVAWRAIWNIDYILNNSPLRKTGPTEHLEVLRSDLDSLLGRDGSLLVASERDDEAWLCWQRAASGQAQRLRSRALWRACFGDCCARSARILGVGAQEYQAHGFGGHSHRDAWKQFNVDEAFRVARQFKLDAWQGYQQRVDEASEWPVRGVGARQCCVCNVRMQPSRALAGVHWDRIDNFQIHFELPLLDEFKTAASGPCRGFYGTWFSLMKRAASSRDTTMAVLKCFVEATDSANKQPRWVLSSLFEQR